MKKPSVSKKTKASAAAVQSNASVAELAIDLWRIRIRATKDNASERTLAAIERAEDRLSRMGFRLDNLEGTLYDSNMNVRVVDHEESDQPATIVECLSPAVYFRETLLTSAEVVVRGS